MFTGFSTTSWTALETPSASAAAAAPAVAAVTAAGFYNHLRYLAKIVHGL